MEKESESRIPRFDTIRPILYGLFVPHVSPSSLLISYYYLSLSEDVVKIKDIGEQAKWCMTNMPRFSKLAKVLRTARNKLEHGEFFPRGLLQKLYKQICIFYELEPNILVKNILLISNYRNRKSKEKIRTRIFVYKHIRQILQKRKERFMNLSIILF